MNHKKIFLSLFLGVMLTGSLFAGDKPLQAQAVSELKERMKIKYNAHDADATINGIVQETLKKCNINRPIIVLQHNHHDNACVATELLHPQEFMVIGTAGKDLDQITATIYHEIGHLAHGDTLLQTRLQCVASAWGAAGASVSLSIATYLNSKKYVTKKLPVNILAGSFMNCAAMLSYLCLYQKPASVLMESRADKFAYEKLVQHGKLSTAIGQVSDYMYQHNRNVVEGRKRPLPSCITGYPHDIQRAKIGLDALKEQDINISHLIQNLPADLDNGIKKHFPDQVKQFSLI